MDVSAGGRAHGRPRIRRLPVLDGERLTGIVTLDDLVVRTGDVELTHTPDHRDHARRAAGLLLPQPRGLSDEPGAGRSPSTARAGTPASSCCASSCGAELDHVVSGPQRRTLRAVARRAGSDAAGARGRARRPRRAAPRARRLRRGDQLRRPVHPLRRAGRARGGRDRHALRRHHRRAAVHAARSSSATTTPRAPPRSRSCRRWASTTCPGDLICPAGRAGPRAAARARRRLRRRRASRATRGHAALGARDAPRAATWPTSDGDWRPPARARCARRSPSPSRSAANRSRKYPVRRGRHGAAPHATRRVDVADHAATCSRRRPRRRAVVPLITRPPWARPAHARARALAGRWRRPRCPRARRGAAPRGALHDRGDRARRGRHDGPRRRTRQRRLRAHRVTAGPRRGALLAGAATTAPGVLSPATAFDRAAFLDYLGDHGVSYELDAVAEAAAV